MENLKVLVGVATVMVANLVFHYLILTDGDVALADRIGVSAYVLLVMVIGGRIVPSFTRNWLNKMGRRAFRCLSTAMTVSAFSSEWLPVSAGSPLPTRR